MTTYRHGALYVVEEGRRRPDLERELKAIDRSLFFERQVTLEDELVWCVCVQVDGDQPPITLLEWRDTNGRPIAELSSGIITRVQNMHRDARTLVDEMTTNNERRRREAEKRRSEEIEELAYDMIPRIKGRRSPAFHRGIHLRRRRAGGEA